MNKGKPLLQTWRRRYRMISLSLAAVFGLVGLLFLLIPEKILLFFNGLSPALGFAASPVQGAGFFLILAVAYMYLVTLLAVMMHRHPDDRGYAVLLVNGKFASSLISFVLFIFDGRFLIYLANGIVDGAIALAVLFLARKLQRARE